jgi:predicted anti-sigma-YlaC factor YlaD
VNLSSAQPASDISLIAAVLGQIDDRLTCRACLAALPAYVEAEIGGAVQRRRSRPIRRHLLLCHDCSSTYLAVLELALMERHGQLAESLNYPRPDLSFLLGAPQHEH